MRRAGRTVAAGAPWLAAAVVATLGSMLLAVAPPGLEGLDLVLGIGRSSGEPGPATFAPVSTDILSDVFGREDAARLLAEPADEEGPAGAAPRAAPRPAPGASPEPSRDGLITPAELTAEPDIRIQMSVDKATVRRGETMRYSMTVRNVGEGVARDVRITSHIPEHTTYVSNCEELVTVEPGRGPGGVPSTFICAPGPAAPGEHGFVDVRNLRPGRREVLVFDVAVNPDAPAGTIIRNHSHVEGPNVPRRTSNEVRTRVT